MLKNSKKKSTAKNLESYEEWLVDFLKNKKQAASYLQASIEEYQKDGNTDALMLAFRHVAIAQGGVAKVAEKAELSRESLYRTLSSKGNPKLSTLGKLLKAMGFKLNIVPG